MASWLLSLVNQPLLPRVDRLQYLTAGRRVWPLTHGFCVNTTRDLGSSNCPIRFENAFAISRDRNTAVRRVTALEESATSRVYKLRPKQPEAVLAFVLGSDASVSPPKVCVPLKIRISMNLVVPAVIIVVATVVVHAGSGNSRCFSLSTSSLSYRVKVNVKVNFIFKHLLNVHIPLTRKPCVSGQTLLPAVRYCKRSTRGRRGWFTRLVVALLGA